MAAQTHKAQHWVPRSYLQAWADPKTPSGQKPFVNVFSKDGAAHRRRAPTNLFTETDLYTIKRPDGGRDLKLEHGLSELEDAFATIRKEFLSKRRQLPRPKRLRLMAFVAAMQARTPSIRDHYLKFWKEVFAAGEQLERRLKGTNTKKRKYIGSSRPTTGSPGMTMEDVGRVISSPMEHLLLPSITAQLPFLMAMQCMILCTNSDPGFITSDCPVVWFDPDWHRKPPMFRSPSFSDPGLEISLPVSHHQLLILCHKDSSSRDDRIEYIDVQEHHADELNRRTRFRCDQEFVVRQQSIRPRWFEKGTMPSDAWEAMHESEAPDPT